MSEFKSSIFEAILAKGIRNGMLIFILYLTSSIINYSELISFQFSLWTLIIIYLIQFVIQIFITNSDLKIGKKEIIVQSSMFKGLRKRKFEIDEISEIIFKDEWSESFMNSNYTSIFRFIILHFFLMLFIPREYKWIQIKTNKNQKFNFYFFGMDYDFYDNSEEILFEDMFIAMANRNIKVKWKSTKDKYFEGMQELANEIYLNSNK